MKRKYQPIPLLTAESEFYFTSETAEKEWKEIDPIVKKLVINRLNESIKMMSTNVAIDTLSLIVKDLYDKIEMLEKANENK